MVKERLLCGIPCDVSMGCTSTFILEVDLLLESLLEVTNVIVFKFDHYQLKRKDRSYIPMSEGQIRLQSGGNSYN